jgi:hypothetical protein
MEFNYDYKIKTEKKETKEDDISFYDKLKIFIAKNKIELGLLFVIIFTIFLSNDLKNSHICNIKNQTKSIGGASSSASSSKKPQATPKTTTTTTTQNYGYGQPGYGQPGYGQPGYGQPGYGYGSQMGYQIKSSLANIGMNKLGNTIMSSEILTKMLCYVSSFIKSILALGSIVLAVMLIPGVPVFGFMLLLFVILRDKMANIKAL